MTQLWWWDGSLTRRRVRLQAGGGTPGGLVQTKQPLHQREEDQGDDRGLQKGQTPPLSPVHRRDSAVEVVSSFRYLGVHISDDLTWSKNTSCLIRKAHQRLYFLRRLRSRRAGELSPDLLLLQMCGGERPVLLHHRVAQQLLGGREEGSARGW
ncbi:hypothetical protein L3Q82_006372 [Scortum barcoo]|uniref:Uncharacterized protein n=1 Tax=Scortum barcoo TaxID=214431 RepID=A0ACB8WYR6_9TELE|nr:hypothetical protein L3Q82_006372 [Scortum barcoo]